MSIFSNKMIQIRHHQSDEGEGPFVSFADLMFGIIFLFLIIIAALLILPKHMVDEPTQSSKNTSQALAASENQVQSLEQQTLDLKAQLAKISQASTAPVPSPPVVSPDNQELMSAAQEKIKQLTSELAGIKAEKAGIQSKLYSSELKNEQSLSEVAAINNEKLSLESQLNAAEKEETQLRAQLSQAQAAASSAPVTQVQKQYATKLFSFNQYSCEGQNCSDLHYEGAYTVFRTGENSFIQLSIVDAPDVRPNTSSNPLSKADLDSRQCTEMFSREQFSFDCYTSYTGHMVANLQRTGPDTYEGEGTITRNGIEVTYHVRWQIIEVNDASFQ